MSSRWILVVTCHVAALTGVLAALGTPLPFPVGPQDGPLGMKFVPLPKATFYMGWDGVKKGTKTTIKDDFEIAIHTVTQGQWQTLMGSNPSWFSREGRGKDRVKYISDADLKHFPVESVSWNVPGEILIAPITKLTRCATR